MAIGYIPTPQDERSRLFASAQITATTNSAAFDLGANFAPGGPGLPIGAVVQASAVDRTTGDETYAIKLQESADGSTGWTDIGVAQSFTATGVYACFGFANRRYVRLVETLAGTTPIVTREAWLNFNLGLT